MKTKKELFLIESEGRGGGVGGLLTVTVTGGALRDVFSVSHAPWPNYQIMERIWVGNPGNAKLKINN